MESKFNGFESIKDEQGKTEYCLVPNRFQCQRATVKQKTGSEFGIAYNTNARWAKWKQVSGLCSDR